MNETDLSALRQEIDRIDLELHRGLMQRGEIIDRLIAVKARQGGGSAFRPRREAQMMRALVERHRGLLPLDTVEGIWRIIISTFTFVQANYSVHVDVSGGDPPMRDSARFHFGFTVPYAPHNSAAGVIAAVKRAPGDLGLVRIGGSAAEGAWWTGLAEPAAPKVIARLPFVERPDHPAGLPVFVVSKAVEDAAARDVRLYAVQIERWHEALPALIAEAEGEIIGNAPHPTGLSLLVAVAGAAGEPGERLRALPGASRIAEVGSHAARFDAASRDSSADALSRSA
ncbi:MAG: chorismate mutase [Methylobacteriaceae bacterium]|nr:chorismate mutase [Methylobacteriaceae bacterium]MBV9392969.1 chorismate mutase [Methylobacteriaceae bacterium]